MNTDNLLPAESRATVTCTSQANRDTVTLAVTRSLVNQLTDQLLYKLLTGHR
jgi:hypothetical protein